MKILIGVDDSKHSRAALEYVRTMKWPEGTRVLVVSAVREVVPAYSEVYAPATAYSDRIMDDLFKYHQEIASDAEKMLREAGLRTEAKVLQGDPRSVIVDVARGEGTDLIVLGSHGRTGFAKLLIGSVASHVVSHAPCSVLVVKTQEPQ
jgi:nucleotide-binding universal stress UspA family protein